MENGLNPTVVVLKHEALEDVQEGGLGLNPTVVVLKLMREAKKNWLKTKSQSNRSGFETQMKNHEASTFPPSQSNRSGFETC